MNKKQKKKLLAKANTQRPKEVTQYLDVLEAAQITMGKQSETIRKAIEMRLFNQHIIDLLSKINTTGNLTPTIDNMTKLVREFDNLAMEYGPYDKGTYIAAVVSQSELSKHG